VAQPYVGEIRMIGFSFAPVGWMLCQGQTLPISENEVLFQLIGTTYGGDGQETFQLPDLQSRVPIHFGTAKTGTTYIVGEKAGVEAETLQVSQMPAHPHPFFGSAVNGTQVSPAGNLPANSFNVTPYINQPPDGNMNTNSITPVGGNQPHENRQPFLCINFIISLFGIFPSQT
jgi:microcystin-dependent protein